MTNAVTTAGSSCALTDAQRKALWKQAKQIANAGRAREVVIDSLTACAGGGHITVTATANGTPTVKHIGIDDFLVVLSENTVDAIMPLMAEAIRMGGATTAAQAKTLLEGTIFYLGIHS